MVSDSNEKTYKEINGNVVKAVDGIDGVLRWVVGKHDLETLVDLGLFEGFQSNAFNALVKVAVEHH